MIEPRVADSLGRFSELSPDEASREVPAAVRAYLEATRGYLRDLHQAGASGRDVNEAHSDMIDRLLRRLFELAEQRWFDRGGEDPNALCVVAVGGYARREMSIHSDVDILFLYADQVTPYVASVTEQMQYWLWDAQVTLGGATRTIADTIQLARSDITVATSVLAPRYLAGSGVLFHRFNEGIRRRLLAKPEHFIEEQIEAMQQRHMAFGESLYLLQPNLKEGAGGLRDYHTSYWSMQAAQSSARGKNDYLHLGLLTESEAQDLFAALDFLWRVRNELHLMGDRKNDQMSFEHQEQIAKTMDYGSDSNASGELPVEHFMRDYYTHARNVLNFSSLVSEQCLNRVRAHPRRRRIESVERGLRVVAGQLEIPHVRQLREDPTLLLESFAIAQANDVSLTRKARRLVRENLDLIDDDFRRSPRARDAFLRVLQEPHRVTRSLLMMNEIGVLACYLPEWEHIVCRWQHVIYHTYTVDVHSIFLVEELRRLYKGDYADELPELTELARSVEDPTAVYLGSLFHDLGKGFGGDHSAKGVVRARSCMERMGLDPELVERVLFLVDVHLLMSHLAQRRDLSDPRLLLEFARVVGDRTNLRNLYLLTVADVRASSRSAWTEWKGGLLRDLFEKTSELLEMDADDPDRAIELIEKRVETRRESARSGLGREGVSDEQIDLYFEMMPRRYFTAHAPMQIVRHAKVVLDYDPESSLATAFRDMRGGFSEFILCTPDVPRLYTRVAGVLAAYQVNILGAHVYTTRSGLALEVYRLSTPAGGEQEVLGTWRAVSESLERVLGGELRVEDLLERRARPLSEERRSLSRQPASVEVGNDESEFYSIVDVAADDRLGLLRDLTAVIADNDFEIYISKAAIVLDQVTDTFYLKGPEGKKIKDSERLEKLRSDLLAVVVEEARHA
ncbi:MAG: [protein-PII] uridylyltransferase [Myxococcales bacterium]|nr:[protein-PII] uridylyltransferase [Myxococcales bacterium]